MNKMIRMAVFLLVIVLASSLVLFSCSDSARESGAASDAGEDGSADDVHLNVYFFNAGKADAIALTTENHTVIIDAGEKGFGSTVLDYLSAEQREAVDYLVITHFDKDHVGGAAKIINSVPVSNVLQSNSVKESDEYEKYTEALESSGISPVTVRDSLTFELDGVVFTVDPPAQEEYENDPSNNSSLILTVECGARRLLFTGDAENDRMAEYISKGLAVDCDLMKVPHHGRWDKNLSELVLMTAPEYAVITSSDSEPEDEKTVALLEECGVETFYTRIAPVIVTCDGENLSIQYDN